MANKNSTYIQSLVSFILDTKPYHSKLTEVVEEYRFNDSMAVKVKERLFTKILNKSAWMYDGYADGTSVPSPTTKIHNVLSPIFRQFSINNDQSYSKGAFKYLRDENTDLPLIPSVFDPTSIQGVGLADAFVQRSGNSAFNEALLEGHDVFTSKGAHVCQIKQVISALPKVVSTYAQEFTADQSFPVEVTLNFNADQLVIQGPGVQTGAQTVSVTGPGVLKVTGLSNSLNYDPIYVDKTLDGVIGDASTWLHANAVDKNSATSVITHVQSVLDAISPLLATYGTVELVNAFNGIQSLINQGVLPSSYETLVQALIGANVAVPVGLQLSNGKEIISITAWSDLSDLFATLSPSILHNGFTDIGVLRKSGALSYKDVVRDDVSITNIIPNLERDAYEEWTVTIEDGHGVVRGSSSGIVGVSAIPGVFTSGGISFNVSLNGELTEGSVITITPEQKITVHRNAKAETWTLVKSNPISYSRPLFESARYGYITSTRGKNFIDILDSSFPAGTIVLRSNGNGYFSVSTTGDASYSGTAHVGSTFNDGRISFKIVAGTDYTYTLGDKFFIEISNPDAEPEDLDLYYGFDMDAFDGDTYVYNAVQAALADYQRKIDFHYDSRFDSYDFSTFNLQLSQNAAPGRKWRLKALPNVSRPLNMQTTYSNTVNSLQPNDPLNPNAAAQFDMVNDVTNEGAISGSDPDTNHDLSLWYADSFSLEYFNETSQAWTSVANVQVGDSYSSTTYGISFTLIEGSKPFIAARSTFSQIVKQNGVDHLQTEYVDGGDTIYWSVKNDPASQSEPCQIESARIPRLVMHGDSYFNTTPGIWTVKFTSGSTFVVAGVYDDGGNVGEYIPGSLVTCSTLDGLSYKDDTNGVHFTIKTGSGLKTGDTFTFTTFESKPSILVHGSVSGWQEPAEYNRYYWNGSIGFKVNKPRLRLFKNNLLGDFASEGFNTVNIRPDSTSAIYTLKSHTDGYWTLYRDGAPVGSGGTIVSDKFLSLEAPTATKGDEFVIEVSADELPFQVGHNLSVVKTTSGRSPTAGDFLLFLKSKEERFDISLTSTSDSTQTALSELGPTNIDLRFVEHNTGSGTALTVTSPEVAITSGWLPCITEKYDRSYSAAVFSDAATHLVARSPITGETIGELSTVNENTIFTWDSSFAAKYLPLNTRTVIVTHGTGSNDNLTVNINDAAEFLISSGGLSTSAMFTDSVTTSVFDSELIKIKMNQSNSLSVDVNDGPFGGFLPGFDTSYFDSETEDGYYDAGLPLVSAFTRAREISLQNVITPMEQAELNDLMAVVGAYVSDPSTTTTADFIELIQNANPADYDTSGPGFGLPAIGMAMEVTDNSSESLGPSISDSAVIHMADRGYSFDEGGYGVGGFDAMANTITMLFCPTVPPVPSTGVPNTGTFDSFETPLHVISSGLTVEVSFQSPVSQTPVFKMWVPGELSARTISVVERVSSTKFRFRLAAPTEFKLGVTW